MDSTKKEFLSQDFLKQYQNKQPDWGFGGLGYIVYKRSYSRPVYNSQNELVKTEEWIDTIKRSLYGAQEIGTNYTKAEAERLFDYVFNLKCSFAGRMLWQLGTPMVQRFCGNSLINCWFTAMDSIESFCFLFNNLMLGGGLGYSVKREHIHDLPRIKHVDNIVHKCTKDADFILPDTREGWISLLRMVLDSYFNTGKNFSYSTILVRGKGEPIKGFGGVSSGPQILIDGITKICEILKTRENKKLRSVDVLDVCNLIGSIVISGNVRRGSQIALGDADDFLYLRAKRWDIGNIPNWRSLSNNSIYADNFSYLSDSLWDGYCGNGEPYGLFNLDLSQRIGRIGEKIEDECSGLNPSMPRGVLIQTNEGILPIEKLENKIFLVKNFLGKYVKAKCILSGKSKIVYRISLGYGKDSFATAEHKWPVFRRGKIEKVKTIELKRYDKIPLNLNEKLNFFGKYSYLTEEEGFFVGYFVGDGWLSQRKNGLLAGGIVFGKNEEKMAQKILNFVNKYKKEPSTIRERINCLEIQFTDYKFCTFLMNKYGISLSRNKSIPFTVWESNDDFIKGFIDGLLSSDGSVSQTEKSIFFASSKKHIIQDFQKLLSFYGIASNLRFHKLKNGQFPNRKQYLREYEQYSLRIGCGQVTKFCKLFTISHPEKQLKLQSIYEASLFSCFDFSQKFARVEKIEEFSKEDVWDITVLDNFHVYPSQFCFSGNCGEITLEKNESCCLSEIFLNRIESKHELIDCAKLLYKTQKAICALNYLHDETNKVVHKNFRLGLSVTGVCQSLQKLEWLDNCYRELREFDKEWSKKNNYPISIKLTTNQPSGTKSLLSGSTPGVHPAFSEYYIRRVQMASNDSLISYCKDQGYYVEYVKNLDGTDNHNTMVVEFPCYAGKDVLLAKNVSAINQLEMIKKMQTLWADNAISCTIYYNNEELKVIKEWLSKNYDNFIKSVSFVLHHEHGFKQPPYQEITKERYEEISSKIKEIKEIKNGDGELFPTECIGNSCPIK
ncbi:MAG: LAGLIDADG family homing endonuclease [Nanoarchaeota archaeon]